MPSISSLLVKKPKYSTFNLSKTVRTTMAPGWIYPIYHKLMYTGDRFRFDIRSFLRTNPVFAPVMGSYKLRIATFVSSLHNYIPTMDYGRNDVDLSRVALPMFSFDIIDQTTAGNSTDGSGATLPKYKGLFTSDHGKGFIKHFGVNETSLFKFLGYPRAWLPASSAGYGQDANSPGASNHILYKSALSFLVYLDCVRNYFINPQEDTYPVCTKGKAGSTPDVNGYYLNVGDSGPYRYFVTNIDKTLQAVRDALTDAYNSGNNDIVAIDSILSSTLGWNPFGLLTHGVDSSISNIKDRSSLVALDHGCLISATYDPDLNNNWMSVLNYNAYSEVAISVTNTGNTGSFTYEQLVRGSRQYDFAIRDAVSGGRYSDILYSQFGVDVRGDMHIPQLVHTMEIPINFEDITSMSDTSGDPTVADAGAGAKLGEQGGVGRGFGSCRPFVVNNSSRGPAYVMVMAWIVPNVDYAQNMETDKDYAFADEFYYPAFDNYALQPRTFENLDASPVISTSSTSTASNIVVPDVMSDDAVLYNAVGYPNTTPMGYQPAYSEMMTDYNEVHGLFCSSLDYWAIIRKWPRITSGLTYYGVDATAYICGSSQLIKAYNYPFAVQDGDDNFQVQFRFDIKATRPKSKAAIPHVL